MADTLTLALPDKSYTVCSQSSPNGLLVECGDETMEYANTFIDPKLFVSKYQLQLPEKSQVTAFLKRENKVKPAVPAQRKQRGK